VPSSAVIDGMKNGIRTAVFKALGSAFKGPPAPPPPADLFATELKVGMKESELASVLPLSTTWVPLSGVTDKFYVDVRRDVSAVQVIIFTPVPAYS
jgi:hypothetical protein